MTTGETIANAPGGEQTTATGNEKFPIDASTGNPTSDSKFITLDTMATFLAGVTGTPGVIINADSTGATECAPAFLAAEALLPGTAGGLLWLPPGTYKTLTGINFVRSGTSLLGAGRDVSIIDATGMPLGGARTPVIGAPGNNIGSTYAKFTINMPVSSGFSVGYPDHGLVGLYPGAFAVQISIDNISVSGGDVGVLLYAARQIVLSNVYTTEQTTAGLGIVGNANNIQILGGDYATTTTTSAANIWITAAGNNGMPYNIHLLGCLIDEAVNTSLQIDDGQDVNIENCVVWQGVNNGIVIGGASSAYGTYRVRLANIHLSEYNAGNTGGVLGTIKINTNANLTKLENITTDPSLGQLNIVDNGVGTLFRNVNGINTAPASEIIKTLPAPQATGGTVTLAVPDTTSLVVGQPVVGPEFTPSIIVTDATLMGSIPVGATIASLQGTVTKTQAANGSFAGGQKVIPMNPTTGFVVGQQVVDTTKPTAIGAGNVIASISANVSITLTDDILLASQGAADTIVGYPTVTLSTPTTRALIALSSVVFAGAGYTYVTPLAAATVSMYYGQEKIVIVPAGTIATLTVTLPPNPVNGQRAGGGSSQIVTALTISTSDGTSVVGAPTTLAVGGRFEMIYRSANTTWYPA